MNVAVTKDFQKALNDLYNSKKCKDDMFDTYWEVEKIIGENLDNDFSKGYIVCLWEEITNNQAGQFALEQLIGKTDDFVK